jgi:hypothetical protein
MATYNPDFDATNTLDSPTLLKIVNENYSSYGLGNLYNAMVLWEDYHDNGVKGEYYAEVYTSFSMTSDSL